MGEREERERERRERERSLRVKGLRIKYKFPIYLRKGQNVASGTERERERERVRERERTNLRNRNKTCTVSFNPRCLVSLFNRISTVVGYLMPKQSF